MLEDPTTSPPIRDFADLVELFRRGARREPGLVGIEHEKIAVHTLPGPSAGQAPGYAGVSSIGALLRSLELRGFREVKEGDTVIALRRDDEQVTLEPGGQVEHSGPPLRSLAELAANHRRHLNEAIVAADGLGLAFLGVGFRPLGTLADVPWMPKRRYVVMREYLPTRGRLAHDMMKRTATVQANLDFLDEADCARKTRTAYGVTSLVTALFAASPLRDGRPSGMESVRAGVWLETDPDRCGLLPFAFETPESPWLFERYTEWALDIPMFFLVRAGEYRSAGSCTFRRFLREGLFGERATLGDWEIHLSTLFPEVRLKPHLELRGADSGPDELILALPALWAGLLYDAEACDAAWRLVAGFTMDEREGLRREVPAAGLAARLRGRPIQPLCGELVAVARAGLARQGQPDARGWLEPLDEIAATGRTASRRIQEAFEVASGDTLGFINAIRYRA